MTIPSVCPGSLEGSGFTLKHEVNATDAGMYD